jgi:hypothetical protein
VSLAAAPWREARVVVAVAAAWQRRRAERWQRNGGGHSHGSCRHPRAAMARHCSGDKDTGGDSNGGGTDINQQSIKSAGNNLDGNSNNDSNNDDDEHESADGAGGSLVRAQCWRQRGSGSSSLAVAKESD